MKIYIACLLLFFVGCFSAIGANKPAHVTHNITEVSSISITIALGRSGDQHQTFSITKETKVLLNGAPAEARDLRGGMEAHVTAMPDKKTAKTIEAHDPKRHPSKGKVG